jgi:hypothetical protein
MVKQEVFLKVPSVCLLKRSELFKTGQKQAREKQNSTHELRWNGKLHVYEHIHTNNCHSSALVSIHLPILFVTLQYNIKLALMGVVSHWGKGRLDPVLTELVGEQKKGWGGGGGVKVGVLGCAWVCLCTWSG